MNKNKLFLAALLLLSPFGAQAEKADYKANVNDALSTLNRLESKAIKPVPPSESHVVLLEDKKVEAERKRLEDARKANMKKGNILKEDDKDSNEVHLKPKADEDWPTN